MKLTTLAVASAAIGFCGLVQAQSPSTNFTLTLAPALTDGATAPPGQTSVGRWTGSTSTASSGTKLVSGEVTGATAASEPVADFWSSGFGNASSSSHDASSGDRVFSNAQVDSASLSATVDVSHAQISDRGNADAWWIGNFELAPHSSVTLTGIASFENDGTSVSAHPRADDFDHECEPYRVPNGFDCRETISDLHRFSEGPGEWGRFTLQGGLDDLDADQVSGLSGDAIHAILVARAHSVSYTVGDNGELSMTITNRLDMVSSGYFYVGVEMMSSATAIPVPEPEAYLCMLLGLGALGGFARWRATA